MRANCDNNDTEFVHNRPFVLIVDASVGDGVASQKNCGTIQKSLFCRYLRALKQYSPSYSTIERIQFTSACQKVLLLTTFIAARQATTMFAITTLLYNLTTYLL